MSNKQYFTINLMLLVIYILYRFNNDSIKEKVFVSTLLILFGGILVVYKFTIADKVEEWWDKSDIVFWYKLNISKEFDNKSKDYIEVLQRYISKEKGTKKDVKRITRIIKRNKNEIRSIYD